ncbi:hypothetical protein [Terrabacter terrigena]|uniref:TIGR02234 family membrane protein n=1 Tax=Terrabacter terrigena TaxID=574718 RepID=A0ABW3N2G6_9MICO
MALLRERVPAGVAALVGVALAAPSVVAPTWRLTTLDSERGVMLFDQQDWGWGRSELLGAGGAVVQDLQNPFGLVLLVGLLALTAAGAVAWVVTTSPWASAAPVASAALLGRLATTVSERHGRSVRDDVHGLAATGSSTVAGTSESLAAVLLCVAVLLMVLSLAHWRMPSAWVARLRRLTDERRGTDPTADEAVTTGRPRSTISSRPAGEHLSGPAVGLGDPERDKT